MSRDYISEAEALDDWEEEPPFTSVTRTVAAEISKVRTLALYEDAKSAKVGSQCKCPGCLKEFTKKSYQQAFCSNKGKDNCKDKFWNRAKPERTERALRFARRY